MRVPLPIAVKKNVLVMEFVGDSEGNPTPALINTEEITLNDYQQVIEQMMILYQKAKLVHADLSDTRFSRLTLASCCLTLDLLSISDIQIPNNFYYAMS